MPHRSIILELTKKKEPYLLTHVEQDRMGAIHFHDALRETVLQRGSTILYCAIIDTDGPDAKG